MNLNIVELAALKEIPYPGPLGLGSERSGVIGDKVLKTLASMTALTHREVLAAIDRLKILGYVERFSLGQVRRSPEGQLALSQNIKHLQAITQLISSY